MEEELPLVISSSFSNLCVEVLDVNFINHYKTSGFLFFNDKEDAKKTANSVVKLKGCLIDVHVDINNLPPFSRNHQIQIKLQNDLLILAKIISN